MAERACVSLHFESISRDFEGSDFFLAGVVLSCGPNPMPIPVSTRGLLHVLIGLAEIWVLQVAPFPCWRKCRFSAFAT